MKKSDGHPDFPVWKLERYLLGELPAPEMERISRLKETDPALAEWIRALEAEHADLAEMHPTGRVAGRIWNRLRESAPAPRRAWNAPAIWVPALGLLLMAALLPLNYSAWIHSGGRPTEEPEETRLKGLQPALFLYRKTGESAMNLNSGDRVRPGDLIQMYYDAAGRGYGAIFSLDRDGNVTWHLPDDGGHSAPLIKGGKVPLGFAFELDSLAGFERFFFVAADRPFELAPVLKEIPKAEWQSPRGPERLRLDKSFFQNSIVLLKEPRI
ncbi:MAG: ActD [Fibrobacteres bacterium]|nr:ActD [Fibrobacterota bacterium]